MCRFPKTSASLDIIRIGHGASTKQRVLCIICKQKQPLAKVTAGSLYADGTQAFACNEHSWNNSHWLLGWAKFAIEQEHDNPTAKNNGSRYLEQRTERPGLVIARHLQVRQELGTTLVLTDNPTVFLSVVRRQWSKLYRLLQRERASTLDARLRREFDQQVAVMKSLKFAVGMPGEKSDDDVYLVTPDSFQNLPKEYRTVYLCTRAGSTVYEELLHQLPARSVLVNFSPQQAD